MSTTIHPDRCAEEPATNQPAWKQLAQKTDAEAVEDWEDEGGAPSHSGKSTVVNDLSFVPVKAIEKEATCT